MAEIKRYYWLKLEENFFEDDTIAWIEEQENGKDYIIFYLKLCLKSMNDKGSLIRYVGERLVPYDVNALAKLTNTPTDTVKVAMNLFIDIGLVKRLNTGEIYMNQINELIGSETDSAKRVRKHRAKQALIESENIELLHCNDVVTKSNTDIEIDIDKELDKEKEKNKKNKPSRHKYGEYQNVLLSDQDLEKLKNAYPNDWKERIERLSEYCASSGKSYKNYLATIRTWARKEKPKQVSRVESEIEETRRQLKEVYGDDFE